MLDRVNLIKFWLVKRGIVKKQKVVLVIFSFFFFFRKYSEKSFQNSIRSNLNYFSRIVYLDVIICSARFRSNSNFQIRLD